MTRTSASAGIARRTASLSACCPGGTTTVVLPAKVSLRMVSATAAAVPVPAATAIVAWVIVSADWPYRLDSVIRALVPPTLVCTTLRTERPARPSTSVPGSAPTGEADQAPTQMPVDAGAARLRGPPSLVVVLLPVVLPSSAATPT